MCDVKKKAQEINERNKQAHASLYSVRDEWGDTAPTTLGMHGGEIYECENCGLMVCTVYGCLEHEYVSVQETKAEHYFYCPNCGHKNVVWKNPNPFVKCKECKHCEIIEPPKPYEYGICRHPNSPIRGLYVDLVFFESGHFCRWFEPRGDVND